VDNLRQFQAPLTFQSEVLGYLAQNAQKKDIKKLNETFRAIDSS